MNYKNKQTKTTTTKNNNKQAKYGQDIKIVKITPYR